MRPDLLTRAMYKIRAYTGHRIRIFTATWVDMYLCNPIFQAKLLAFGRVCTLQGHSIRTFDIQRSQLKSNCPYHCIRLVDIVTADACLFMHIGSIRAELCINFVGQDDELAKHGFVRAWYIRFCLPRGLPLHHLAIASNMWKEAKRSIHITGADFDGLRSTEGQARMSYYQACPYAYDMPCNGPEHDGGHSGCLSTHVTRISRISPMF